MAERIPQSTAYLVVFRAFQTDGVTLATGKTIAITISKNGATSFSNPNAGATNATEMASGFYKFTLDTTDTGTLGPLAWRGAVSGINDAGDVLTVAAPADVNVTKIGGTSQTAKDLGAINVTNLNTLSGHDPGATLGTSTLTQTQVTGGAYALNSSSFAFNAALDFSSTMKTSLNSATPAVTVSDKTGFSLANGAIVTATFGTCDFTSTMKTSIGTAVAASAVASVTGNIGGNVLGSVASVAGAVGSVTGAVGSVAGNIGGNVVGSVGSVTGLTASNLDATVSSRLASGSYTAPPSAATIADTTLRRTMAHVEASSDGDTLGLSSVYGLVQMAQESAVSGTTLTVKKTDGSTTLDTKTVATDAAADPITGVS